MKKGFANTKEALAAAGASAEKPDKILYYEAYVETEADSFTTYKIAAEVGFKTGEFTDVIPMWFRSANKESVVEQLDTLVKALKKNCAKIRLYRYGAIFVDSNNWDTLGVLGNDPHADKR